MSIEPKVRNATGSGLAVGIVTWLLTTYVFHGALPPQVDGIVQVVVPALATFAAGYVTRHVERTNLMNIWTELEKVFEGLRNRLTQSVGAQLTTDVHAIIDQAKADAASLVKPAENLAEQAGQDAVTLAEQAAGDVAKDVGLAAGAVNPAAPAPSTVAGTQSATQVPAPPTV